VITAHQILEKYAALYRIPRSEESVPVFKNPDRREMWECGKNEYIRFLANAKTQEIYVWDGTRATHHTIITQVLKKSFYPLEEGEIIGEAQQKGGPRWEVDWEDVKYNFKTSGDLFKIFQKYDWSWINQYKIDMESVQKTILALYGNR
jgi:hypothetical protein